VGSRSRWQGDLQRRSKALEPGEMVAVNMAEEAGQRRGRPWQGAEVVDWGDVPVEVSNEVTGAETSPRVSEQSSRRSCWITA
jgi:hypothetical protein